MSDKDNDLVSVLARIASAFEGMNDELRKAGNRYWPEPKPQREAIVSRIPTEEDKAKENLGIGDDRPIDEWLNDLGDTDEDDGAIGERTRQWLRDHAPQESKVSDAGTETSARGKQKRSSSKKTEGKA